MTWFSKKIWVKVTLLPQVEIQSIVEQDELICGNSEENNRCFD